MRSSIWNVPCTPEGPGRPAARGSALVVVIGTLALISVFAAIYISIGRSDTRATSTNQIRTQQGDLADQYIEHAISVIRDDRLDATMQFADQALQYQVPRRETTDAPYTDWSMRSQSDDPADWFFPKGGNPFTRESGDRFDPRVPSDPWLASLRPEFLGDPLDTPFSLNTSGLELEGFLDRRDWLQITNIAPDGRFVNLFNLRPQEDDSGAIGGFNAEPGWGSTNFGPGENIRRMSEGLSLYQKFNSNDPESAIQSFDPVSVRDFWIPGATDPASFPGLTSQDVQNTPAVWSMYQRFALIPLDQPFVTYNRSGSVSTWADPDFPAYQWADADGDGFADSRWFELTVARDNLTDGTPRDDVQRLYDAGEFRVFAAARAVDLSGMVNVNVARDSLNPPTARFPLGLTPVEVDLRRLLTMQDQAEQFDGDINGSQRDEPLSFAHLRRPAIENGIGQEWARLPASDYSRYRHFTEDGVTDLNIDPGRSGENGFPGGPSPSQREFPNAMLIGRYAASAIHESVVRNITLPETATGPLSLPAVLPPADLVLTEGSPLLRDGESSTEFNTLAQQRIEYYNNIGSIDPTRLDEAGVRSLSIADPNVTFGDVEQYYGMGLFGVEDLAELLTFHGLNDPEVTSRLELAAQGRFQYQGGTGDERFSPLLSTRPLSLDRDLHGQIPVLLSNPNRGTEVTGEISRESMALMTLSPRTKLTPVSGSVPMPAAGIAGAAGRNGAELAPTGLLDQGNRAVSLDDFAMS
ncbi:MAG: hypothetical protein AAGA55_11565, partial [Planctomycetota bacterium]